MAKYPENKELEEKLKLIREAENVVGFKKFKVSKKSTKEELDNVLGFIFTASTELEIIARKIESFSDD